MSSSKYTHRQERMTQWAPDIVYNTSLKLSEFFGFVFQFFFKIILVILIPHYCP